MPAANEKYLVSSCLEAKNWNLSQCEICMCSNSGCRDYFEKLTCMKDHIQNEQNEIIKIYETCIKI